MSGWNPWTERFVCIVDLWKPERRGDCAYGVVPWPEEVEDSRGEEWWRRLKECQIVPASWLTRYLRYQSYLGFGVRGWKLVPMLEGRYGRANMTLDLFILFFLLY